MSFERNVDLPAELRSGLNADQQNIVRGLMNALVFEREMTPLEASQIATSVLQSSGMVYNNGWKEVAKSDGSAIGVITKVDEDKRLVFGWASIIKDTEGRVLLDRQDDYIDDESELEKSAYDYVLHSRDGGEMHVRKGVSTMVESVVLTKEKQVALGIPEGTVPVGWWIGFRVNDENVWQEVKKGGYVGFSVHGTGHRNEAILKEGEYTEVEKRDFTTEQRQKMAEEGKALPDGSYPIANKEDLQNALQAIGRAKNRAQVLRHIRSRAKDLGLEEMLPDWAMSKSISKEEVVKRAKRARGMMSDMMDCPECGERIEKGSVCKCGYDSMESLRKGDRPGHPFRGNQHTRGSYQRSIKGKVSPQMEKETEQAAKVLTNRGLDHYTRIRGAGHSALRRQFGIRSNTHEATMAHMKRSYPHYFKGSSGDGRVVGRKVGRKIMGGKTRVPRGKA